MRAGRPELLLLGWLVACGAPPKRIAYVPPPPPPAVQKGPPPKFRWATRPPETGELFVAVEGPCPFPAVWPTKHAMLFTYGVESKASAGVPDRVTTVARFTQEGLEDLSNGLPPVIAVDRIAGTYPEGLWLQESAGTKGHASDRIWRWRSGVDGRDGWQVALLPEPDHSFRIPTRWAGGYVAVEELSDPSSGVVNLALRGLDLPTTVAVPDLMPPDFGLTDLVGFDSGELFAVGSRPSEGTTLWSARWVSPTDKVVTVHTFGASSARAELFAPTPDNVEVRVGAQSYAFDGGSWSPVPTPPPPWAPPVPEPGAKVVLEGAHAWALAKGELLRWNGQAWAKVDVPAPAFSATAKFKLTDLSVSQDGEAFVMASYVEKGPNWPDSVEMHAVLRSHRPYQTMRCNEPDPESASGSGTASAGRGVQSWPPVADETCATPFVVLARRSNAHPQAPDYAPLRLPLRGHDELEPLVIMDVESGDRRYIGVPVKDVATGKKLLQAEAKALDLHGEIVCAQPTPVRTLPIDLRTGAILKDAKDTGDKTRRRR